jgi:hypothetical protein
VLAIVLVLIGTSLAANATPVEWYESRGITPPHPRMRSEMARDKVVFERLRIPALLAILRYELSEGRWRDLSRTDRTRLLQILDDRDLQLVYTGKQSLLAHSSGAQTLGAKLIKINQEGFYKLGAPLSYYQIAQHILHELGHVYQIRHNWLPRPGRTKEWFPESLEGQLNPASFSSANMARIAGFLSGKGAGVHYGYFGGKWICPARGIMELTQTGSEIEGKMGGFENGSGHWGKSGRKGGRLKGTVKGPTAELEIKHGDGTTTTATATLVEGGLQFSGDYKWFRDGRPIGSGNWGGQR